MKPVAFDYARPASLEEARALLGSGDILAKVLAGGQSLGPMLNLRLVQPDLLVDVTRLPELHRVEEQDEAVVIGACVTTAELEDGCVPGRTGEVLAGVAGTIAYRAVRNRGTIGGSLAHADPAGDWLSCLAALGAGALIRGPGGLREVPVERFVLGAFEVALEAGEILEAVRVPKVGPGARWSYHKFCRKTGEFAEAIAAILDDPERDVCRVVAGATDSRPVVWAEGATLFAGARRASLAQAFQRDAARAALAREGLEGYELQVHLAALGRAAERAR